MTRPLKIAFVVVDDRFTKSAPSPFFGTAPTALLQGFEELGDEVEVHVICCTMGDHPAPEKIGKNIWFHAQSVPKWGFLRTLHWGCRRATRRMIDKIQPDVIHAQGTERWCAISVTGLPFPKVLTIHGYLQVIDALMKPAPRAYWKLQTLLERIAIPCFAGVVAISSNTAQRIAPFSRKTWTVPNATDDRYFSIERAPSSPPVVLYVANIMELKNQVGFLDAIAPLAEQFEFRLRFCGHIDPVSEYAKKFLARVEECPWAEFAGKVSRDGLATELKDASILALASHVENCPMVILEGMSAGLPILASSVGGVPDLISPGVNGFLCETSDPASIREGLRELLERPERAEQMGKAGRQRALERYLPVQVARRHLEIYREVSAGGKPANRS